MASTHDRTAAGEPPTTDELLAYSRGELPAHEAARVHRLLAQYPELAHALTVPFDGEGDALPDEVVDRQWRSFRRRHLVRRRPLVWQASTAVAAALALTFGALFLTARRELDEPRVIAAEQILQSGDDRGSRGGAETVLSENSGDVVLIASLSGQPVFPRYRVDVTARGTLRWSAIFPARGDGDLLRILIPSNALDPGTYAIALYGIDDGRIQKLIEYPVRVEARAR